MVPVGKTAGGVRELRNKGTKGGDQECRARKVGFKGESAQARKILREGAKPIWWNRKGVGGLTVTESCPPITGEKAQLASVQ